jgi:hypothetical protein
MLKQQQTNYIPQIPTAPLDELTGGSETKKGEKYMLLSNLWMNYTFTEKHLGGSH